MKVGDTVEYTVVVTNSGNVTVSGIELEDTLVTLSEAAFDLAPEGTKTVTYTYTVTQADVDAGTIDNTATATGTDPQKNEVTASGEAQVTTVDAEAALTVEKSADPTEGVKVGDPVDYTVTITNSGNVTVSGITLKDSLVSLNEDEFDLEPAGSKTITYQYEVQQTDVDAGQIDNTVTATGRDPKKQEVTASDDAKVTTEEAAAELYVEKTADPESGVKVGDTVTYTVLVTNTGNVSIKDIRLSDTLVTLNDAFPLAPGRSKEITYTYTVTQADVDAGQIDNTVTAAGTDPKGTEVTASDDAKVTTVTGEAALTVEKSADNVKARVDDVVTYTVVVTNVGNVTVSSIELSDTLVTLSEDAFDLAPGVSKTITYTYKVTQADMDAGQIDNTVTAAGKDPKGADVTETDSLTIDTEDADVSLTVTKTAYPENNVKAGDTVYYDVAVTNSGNVTLSGIELEDTLVTLSEAAFDLAPNESKIISYTYTATQADVDEGQILNTATATGRDPKKEEITKSASATVKTEEPAAELSVEKTAAPTSGVKAGDTVEYTVVVTNSGNVTVSGIGLEDTLVTLSEAAFDLAPAESKTITYTYTVTQADVDEGQIDNTVTAAGTDPKKQPVTASDDAAVTTEEAAAELTVEKSADPASNAVIGGEIQYTAVITNSGNVTVSAIELEDSLVTLTEAAFDLAPGESKTVTYSYKVTQADADAGSVPNTITATGVDPKKEEVTASDDVTVTIEIEPGMTLTKTADAESYQIGDTVNYTIVVENTGNVTISGISVEDELTGGVTPSGTFTLAPGSSKTLEAKYEVTAEDVTAGSIVNTAAAAGTTAHDGQPITAEDTVTVAAVPIEIVITAADDEWEYDGLSHQHTGDVRVTSGTLRDGDELEAVAEGSVTDVADTADGNNPIAAGYKITRDGVDVTAGYSITTEAGTLTITPKAVTVTAVDQEKKYGDNDPDLTVTIDGRISEEDEIKYEIGREAGETVEGSPYTITPEGDEEQGNYTVTYETGKLTITKGNDNDIVPVPGDEKEEIDLESKSITVEYDGASHTVGAKADKDGSTIWYQYDGGDWTQTPPSRTDVGSTDFAIKATNPNYEDVVKEGYTLTVTPKAVTITAEDHSFAYDGSAKTWPNYTVEGLVGEDEIEAVITGSITYVSESPVANVVSSYEFTKGDPKNYEVTTADGELTMTNASREITITAASQEWPYDGLTHQNTEVKLTGGELFEGDKLVAEAIGSVRNVADTAEGNNPVAEGYKVMNGTEDVTANYAITAVAGKLSITPIDAKITAQDDSQEYNGEALTNEDFESEGILTDQGDKVESVVITGSQTDVGKSDNVPSAAKIVDADGADVTANYNIEYVNGSLEVTPKEVTITTGSDEKEYDGAELTNSEAEITGLVAGEVAVVAATGTQTEVGESENTYDIAWGSAKESNYTIKEELGTLKVTINSSLEITLTAPSASKEYDGTELTADGSEDGKKVEAAGLPEGFTVEATATGSQLDAGESANVVNGGYIIRNAKGEDKTANFSKVKLADGKLEVTPATLTITTGSAQKVYDGTPLTNDEVTVDGLVNGETLDVKAIGTQTEVGSSPNGVEIAWPDLEQPVRLLMARKMMFRAAPGGQAKSTNYNVVLNLGTLTVTRRSTPTPTPDPNPTPTPTPTPTPDPGTVLGANRIDPEIPMVLGEDRGQVLGAARAQTGDESNLLLWILLMLASAAGMGVAYRKQRRDRKAETK